MNKIYSVDLYGMDYRTPRFFLSVNRLNGKNKYYYAFTPARRARVIQFMLGFAARVEKQMSEQEA